MENNFHILPPLKRFRIIAQHEPNFDSSNSMVSSNLPAKKRKESRDFNIISTTATTTTTIPYCLPTKKRVWAFPPDDIIPNQPLSPFDLNIEYKPTSIENDKQTPPDYENQVEVEENRDPIGPNEDGEGEDADDEDEIICVVCQSTDGDPIDPIVLCDGCDLMVHKSCYGNPLTKAIPEGDWFCNQCLSKPDNEKPVISCCLCPSLEGAMKLTNDGRWAHIVCALFVPEVFFEDSVGRDGIDCSMVAPRRWEQKCYVCDSDKGCVVDCSEAKCSLAFHVTCGLKEELCLEYQEGRKKCAIVAGFCKDHTELWKKQQLTGKFKIVAREEQICH